MQRANAQATAIFAEIGVRIDWKAGRPHRRSACPREIELTIVPAAPADAQPGARAYTDLSDGAVTVFFDRIRPALANWPRLAPLLLAHVFAHEIAHALQRIDRHSETGIMKAQWTYQDYRAMEERPLRFTPLDAGLIRAGAAGSCAAAQ
jgi:hypothetical protein